MSFYQFSVPTKILHDEGISQNFANDVLSLGVTKIFVVTDKFLAQSGLCEPVFSHLRENGVEITGVFNEVPPDSSVTTVEQCAAYAKKSGAEGFLAIGGGSVMDTAKAANILFTLGGDFRSDYVGAQTLTEDLAPLVAIPTTAGTGSEVTEAIVIYDHETATKLSFVDIHLLPDLAVLDPLLTQGLPPLLTAATGLDALTHAMESVVSVQHNPVSDALACQAIALIRRSLPAAVRDGKNIAARSDMLIASNLAGIAFNHAMVGVVHAVAHSIGALAHVHHGTANGIFLPFGLEYNLDTSEDRIALMAPAFGMVSPNGQKSLAKEVISGVRKLIDELHQACAFPVNLQSAGVKQDLLRPIAEKSVQDGASFYNPRELTVEEIMPFLERAFA